MKFTLLEENEYWVTNKKFQEFITKKDIENGQRAVKNDRRCSYLIRQGKADIALSRDVYISINAPKYNPNAKRLYLPTNEIQILKFLAFTYNLEVCLFISFNDYCIKIKEINGDYNKIYNSEQLEKIIK